MERKQKSEALQALVHATRWIADCKLKDILLVLAFFHEQHTCYLECTSGQETEAREKAFSFQVITNTLTDMAGFRNEWPDVTIDELTNFCELYNA